MSMVALSPDAKTVEVLPCILNEEIETEGTDKLKLFVYRKAM